MSEFIERFIGILPFMLAPMAECLVLVGIHSYLGIHVIRRGVIFIDLALAQIAALGTTVGLLLGLMPETPAAFIFSILFTFIGAAIFATTRIRSEKIPQEAIIGLVYALAAAVAIIVIDKGPHGSEHLKEVLVGRIVWVRWVEVGSAAAAYLFVGFIHVLFHKNFMLISMNPKEAYRRKMNVRLWDFIFYMTFGFVISFSVHVAGVILVFVFLVVPAVTAIMITDRFLYQLIIGWTMGTVVTILGIFLSYFLNLPGGPTVVAFYGLMLLFIALPLYVIRAKDRARAFQRVVVGTVVAAAVVAAMYFIAVGLRNTPLARDDTEQHHHHHHGAHGDHGEGAGDSGMDEIEIVDAEEGEDDADELLEKAEALLEEGKKEEALDLFQRIASWADAPPFFRDKAKQHIEKIEQAPSE